MSFDEFVAQLSPKLKKEYFLASEVEKTIYPTVSKGLNKALGGGFVAGRIATMYGAKSTGKSTLLLQSIPKWQEMGLNIVWADLEGTYDKDWASKLGVDNDKLLITGSRSAEELANQLYGAVKAGADIIIIDSISAIVPANFIDKDGELKPADERKQIGARAKAIKLVVETLLYHNKKAAILLISQTTTDLSGMHAEQKHDGGNSVDFNSTHILKINSSSSLSQQIEEQIELFNGVQTKLPVARNVELLVTKNKIAPAFRKAKYVLYYDGPMIGIDVIGELFELGLSLGLISQAGPYYSFRDQKFQGRANFVKELKENDEFRVSLETAIGGSEE